MHILDRICFANKWRSTAEAASACGEQSFRGELGQVFLQPFPDLPLAQRVGEQHHDDLGGDGVQFPGAKAGEIVDAFELAVPFFDRGALPVIVEHLATADDGMGREQRPLVEMTIGGV